MKLVFLESFTYQTELELGCVFYQMCSVGSKEALEGGKFGWLLHIVLNSENGDTFDKTILIICRNTGLICNWRVTWGSGSKCLFILPFGVADKHYLSCSDINSGISSLDRWWVMGDKALSSYIWMFLVIIFPFIACRRSMMQYVGKSVRIRNIHIHSGSLGLSWSSLTSKALVLTSTEYRRGNSDFFYINCLCFCLSQKVVEN